MDLVTLVAACALTVDPKLVHALIWHQSGGEPWAFSVPGERQPQVYPSAQEAIREARFAEGVPIRVGLTGLATDSRTATLAMFMPCANISIAARQITQLARTQDRSSARDRSCPLRRRRFWEHPDKKFADAVLRSVVKADAPNFDMQNATYGGSSDIPPQAPDGGRHASTTSPVAPDDQQRGWSSALFPARSQQFGRVSTGQGSNNPDADRLQETNDSRPHDPVTMVYSCADCLSGGRNDWFEDGSHDFACCRAFGSEARGRRRPDRPMAG